MKKFVLILIISLLVSILPLVSMVQVIPAAADPETTFYVDPPSIIDLTMEPPATFSVDIVVKDVEDLYGFEFRLNYKTTVLTATGATYGSFFPPGSWEFAGPAKIDDTAGYVRYGVTLPYGSKPEDSLSGSGTLATVTFTVEGYGGSPLDLVNTKLPNPDAEPIPHTAYDGYFSNVPLPKVGVDPESIVDPDLAPGDDFTINVEIADATDLYSYEFFLNYTTVVLNATAITLGDFFPADSIVRKEINDTVGYVWYNVTMPTVSEVDGNGTLATIAFDVESTGESRLDLSKTRLIDSMGSLIEHYVVDGYFSNKPRVHDIAITQVMTKRYVTEYGQTYVKAVSEVHAGEHVNVTALVINNGTASESFNVTAYYDDTSIGTETLTDFQAGASQTLTFEWNTAPVAEGNYTIWAEASGVADDNNLANNKFFKADKFRVLPSSRFPIELVVAVIVVLIIPATAVYFLKFRKPKSV